MIYSLSSFLLKRRRYAIIFRLLDHIISSQPSLKYLSALIESVIKFVEDKLGGELRQWAPLPTSQYFKFGDPMHKTDLAVHLNYMVQQWGEQRKQCPPLTKVEIYDTVSHAFSVFSNPLGPSKLDIEAVFNVHPFPDGRSTSPEPFGIEYARALQHQLSIQDNSSMIPTSFPDEITIDRQTDPFGSSDQAYVMRALVADILIREIPLFSVLKVVAGQYALSLSVLLGGTLRSFLKHGASIYWLFRCPCLPDRVSLLLKRLRRILYDKGSLETLPTARQIDEVIARQVGMTPEPSSSLVLRVLSEFPVPSKSNNGKHEYPFDIDYARRMDMLHRGLAPNNTVAQNNGSVEPLVPSSTLTDITVAATLDIPLAEDIADEVEMEGIDVGRWDSTCYLLRQDELADSVEILNAIVRAQDLSAVIFPSYYYSLAPKLQSISWISCDDSPIDSSGCVRCFQLARTSYLADNLLQLVACISCWGPI